MCSRQGVSAVAHTPWTGVSSLSLCKLEAHTIRHKLQQVRLVWLHGSSLNTTATHAAQAIGTVCCKAFLSAAAHHSNHKQVHSVGDHVSTPSMVLHLIGWLSHLDAVADATSAPRTTDVHMSFDEAARTAVAQTLTVAPTPISQKLIHSSNNFPQAVCGAF